MNPNEKFDAVFVCCPTHNGQLHYNTAKSFFIDLTQKHNLLFGIGANSLLAHGFNGFLCDALNKQKQYNIKWFAMLHADVVPEPFWLDKLIDIAEQHSADLLSVVIPFKDASGLTSTAVSHPMQDYGSLFRITLKQIHGGKLPETFGLADVVQNLTTTGTEMIENFHLLVNTGCMLLRIDQPWSDQLFFTINDAIVKTNGTYTPQVEPEDWFLSKLVAQKGGKVMATSAIKVTHVGGGNFTNALAYGHETDPVFNPDHI